MHKNGTELQVGTSAALGLITEAKSAISVLFWSTHPVSV